MPKRVRGCEESSAVQSSSHEDNDNGNNESSLSTRQSKRSRKVVDNLTIESESSKKKVLVEGNGKALKDIPAINKSIRTYPASSYHYYLESLHHVLYGFAGTNKNRRQHILNFSGFPIDDEESRERKRKQLSSNTKYSTDLLKIFLTMLCIDHAGVKKKEALIDLLLDFLFDPK